MFKKLLIEKYIINGFDKDEAVAEIDLVIEILADLTVQDMFLDNILDDDRKLQIMKAVEERVKTRKPIQQILGEAYFMGNRFFVNEFTLIPRPETEFLVLECLKILKHKKNPKILDIGCGSGCISIELAKKAENAAVTSVDICKKALSLAKDNASRYEVSNKIDFFKSDIFEMVSGEFDLIVSNPPYIPIFEKENLQIEVRDFEPHNALFTIDNKGLEFYQKIIKDAQKYLKYEGYIAFEIGINQSESVKKLLEVYGFKDINIIDDLDSVPRVISARV